MLKRKNFAKLKEVFEIPNMLDIQTISWNNFLQMDMAKSKRKMEGLQQIFSDGFPIENFEGSCKVEFISYSLEKPKYSILECQRRGITYASSLRIKLRLKSKKETKEQDVYLCDFPLMTQTGTFIINGDERVVVSQLHRSPGVSFAETVHPSGRHLYLAKVIPYRGAWIEFEFDITDTLSVFIDRRRKVLSTTFLRALGFSANDEILRVFCGLEEVKIEREAQFEKLLSQVIAEDIIDPATEVLILEKFSKLNEAAVQKLISHNIRNIKILKQPVQEILNTLRKDHTKNQTEALIDIFRKLRPGDPPTIESAKLLINRLFFDPKRYDLGQVGRYMFKRRLGVDMPEQTKTLTAQAVVKVIEMLIRLKNGDGQVDDIDHLGNRRIKTVGELLENQFRIGLARLERSIKERMAIYDIDDVMPHSLINSKLVSGVIKDFFGRSQLSQFMDQTNPLAELTHKRRLSALGPGGLSRERAGFEVRDVHHSHYGRICPVETPEGPNIGLIASLCTYARINKYGFIETPYRRVASGKVTGKIDYLSADIEDKYIVAQANAPLNAAGHLSEEHALCRHKGDFPKVDKKKVDYMDVSPRQLVSVATGLIPFLEHDDANRALMGSNMQRQAVPLLTPEPPLVGTGLEHRAAKDSGAVVVAKADGIVKSVQADEIVIGSAFYKLKKFVRSNADTCINQKIIVRLGQKLKAGNVIADGAATKNGEMALGRNVLAAFMPWRGYNFEDAVLVSERIVKEDVFTSIHIEKFEIEARDTRLGNEEITRDIPNVGEDALKDLDENGIIMVGAEVHPGDILVGKITPKSETELSPEEKLLRAIFGEKAGDVRDASLVTPPGAEGIVVDVKVFSRKTLSAGKKDRIKTEQERISQIKKFYHVQIEKIRQEKRHKISKLLIGAKLAESLTDEDTHKVVVAEGETIRKAHIKKLLKCKMDHIKLYQNLRLKEELNRVVRVLDEHIDELVYEMEVEIDKIKRGDELPPGVLKKVIIFIAAKRKMAVGDKIAGRHGNKGVIAKILPQEDMPFLPDGTPVDIVLNPLGVPSRMNVGQILETHLGWAAKTLGIYVASSIFDGANEAEIRHELKKAGLPEDGKTVLCDGFTGEPFMQKVTVGYIYMMKLAHLVDDKIHARSIGPYSLVTQQPLGGKAQFGGQRFGEMEVWALEAYGAAHTLQELLTVKSDDVSGRTRIYEAIVKGEIALQPGMPESFNVLVKELQSLALDVRLEKNIITK